MPPPAPEPIRARILVVGDLLMHLPLTTSSYLDEQEWDFTPLFESVQPWIASADIALANLETTLTGDRYPWAGYPSFNTPPEFARDLKKIGFDVITHANNHALDYSEYGLNQTIAALDRYGLVRTGAARTEQERNQILVAEILPGLRIAVLSYTYGTNGVPLPHPWSVNLLDPDRMQEDVRRARTTPGVDLVAVALHMGEEYARQPNAEQESYVKLLTEAGVDIVLGNHPHVIQKIVTRHVIDQFNHNRSRAIIYSLGNFISNQNGLPREAGLMLLLDVQKKGEETTIEKVYFVPTWVHSYTRAGVTRYRVLPVEQAMQDYVDGVDPLLTEQDYQRLKDVLADTMAQAIGGPEVSTWSVDEPYNPFRKQEPRRRRGQLEAIPN